MRDPALKLTYWQRQGLQRQLRQASEARVYRRLLALLLLDRGDSPAQVAETLGVARRTVYYWLAAYTRAYNPADLDDAPGAGRPTLWTDHARALLRELLATTPDCRGYYAGNWTVPLLQEELEQGTGIAFSEDAIRDELHRLGYVWKRPRYVLDPDPEVEKKTTDSLADRPPGAA
jgi:transposase